MGWLKDLMNHSTARVPSFGRLAQLCLEHPEWPSDHIIKERSLSTLFSKIDRGQETEWLRERPHIQKVLANIMARAPSEIRLALGDSSTTSDGRILRLTDVRFAREIDLTREPLPPGIPSEAYDPPVWGPSVWIAPSGSGRSLAGAWLHARGLAKHALVRSDDDLKRVPSRGALFVELGVGIALDEQKLAALRPGSRPLLIAGDFSSHVLSSTFPGFITIRSPRVEEYLPELIDWVGARLGEEGHFDPDAAEHWMRKVALAHGAAEHLADALGLLGMLDELTPKLRAGKSLAELGASFVRHRIRDATDRDVFGPKVAEETYRALEYAATRSLLVQGQSIRVARSESEWTALLAEQSTSESPDPAWFHTALRTTLGRSISRKELRRATQLLPPQAFQLVRALEHSELLRKVRRHASASPGREETTDALELGPHFLVRLLESHAENEALTFSSREWGALLLMEPFREKIAEALLERALAENWDTHFGVLEEDAEPDERTTAAVEMAFTSLVFAELLGRRPPMELRRALAYEFRKSLLEYNSTLEPRVAPLGLALYSRDAALAAWCVFSAENRRGSKSPFLLGKTATFEGLACVHRMAFAAGTPPLLRDALLVRLAEISKLEAELPELPVFQFIEELKRFPRTEHPHEKLMTDLEELGERIELPSFVLAAESRGLAQADCLAALWSLSKESPTPFSFWAKHLDDLYSGLPASLLEARISSRLPLSFERVLPHQLAEFVRSTPVQLPKELVRAVPLESLVNAARNLLRYSPDALEELATKSPPFAGELFSSAAQSPQGIPEEYLDHLPSPAASSLMTELTRDPTKLDRKLTPLLLTVVRRRLPGSNDAFRLLEALEQSRPDAF